MSEIFQEARRGGQALYDALTGSSSSDSSVQQSRTAPRTGREDTTDVIDTGVASEGTGGSRPQQTFTARQKYMEYLDDLSNMNNIALRGTREGRMIKFNKREDLLAYQSAKADVNQFQNDNAECDEGNRGACNRSGRGNAPTDYASPFQGSQHFDDFAYFGAGGVRRNIPATGSVVPPPAPPPPEPVVPSAPEEPEPAPAPTTEDRKKGEREAELERELQDIEREIGELLPPAPEEPIDNNPTAVDGSGKEHLPNHNQGHRDSISGAGVHTGSRGGTNHGADGFEPLPVPNTTGINEYKRNRKQYDFIETTNVFNFRPCETI